jgi:hypothetical protein
MPSTSAMMLPVTTVMAPVTMPSIAQMEVDARAVTVPLDIATVAVAAMVPATLRNLFC